MRLRNGLDDVRTLAEARGFVRELAVRDAGQRVRGPWSERTPANSSRKRELFAK